MTNHDFLSWLVLALSFSIVATDHLSSHPRQRERYEGPNASTVEPSTTPQVKRQHDGLIDDSATCSRLNDNVAGHTTTQTAEERDAGATAGAADYMTP